MGMLNNKRILVTGVISDRSIAAGIAGLGVGAGLFFLGGLLSFTADSMGIQQNSQLPQ